MGLARLHGGSSMESGFEPRAFRPPPSHGGPAESNHERDTAEAYEVEMKDGHHYSNRILIAVTGPAPPEGGIVGNSIPHHYCIHHGSRPMLTYPMGSAPPPDSSPAEVRKSQNFAYSFKYVCVSKCSGTSSIERSAANR
ncbi:hypothetical protein AVEN_225229-1 [Araneus ventricosus]|uniref:Uncharacterized protein n=1 Tax=Araneus ventricosus TaxID=182803 RepID=A0A4Y2AKW8_ARAVE|nr:hypothetical protein AVEN_225229-1 [Araneus ventricosus]